MAQFSDNLFSLTGRVMSFRPNVDRNLVKGWVNDRVRQALDSRTYWSDLLSHGVISIPNFYNQGTVNVETGSNIVTGGIPDTNGNTTEWPVNDVVNTTVTAGITEIGYVTVTPVSMAGINIDTYLYVDAAGTPETVVVVQTTPTTFTAQFQTMHAAPTTLTSSSLAGRQFRISEASPIYTVISIQNANQLTINIPWGGIPFTNMPYQIVKAYYTLAPNLKDVLYVIDSIQGIPLRIHVPVMEINWRDPQRSSTGPPLALVDLAPSDGGSMQYELWPWQFGTYQLGFIFMRQWPDMQNDTDRPPWFINPTIFFHGALADALNFKVNEKDIYHNPKLAMYYEERFQKGLEDAKNADESKFQRAYDFNFEQLFGSAGANFWQSHDPDVMAWNL